MSDLLARHRAVIPSWVALNYADPIEITGGKGCRVTDAEGHSYLDFFAGILTNMLGYDVPEVRDAVERQIASGVVHTSTLYLIRGQVELAEKIAKLSGIPNAKVFFTNSGTEANEVALLAALRAVSLASEPELVKNTLAPGMPETFAIFSASSTWLRIRYSVEVCTTPLPICRSTASRTSGTS